MTDQTQQPGGESRLTPGWLYLSKVAPGGVLFDEDETRRIDRIRIAERLHVLPTDVDRMPAADFKDMLAVIDADEMFRRRNAGEDPSADAYEHPSKDTKPGER